MNKYLTEKLIAQYPILYRNVNKPKGQSNMRFGFECEDGWYDIINELSSELEEINKDLVKKGKYPIMADCVKEKFASLRFYTSGPESSIFRTKLWKISSSIRMFFFSKYLKWLPYSIKYILCSILDFILPVNKVTKDEKLIMDACNKCGKTCEICGNPGELRDDLGWWQTLCLSHYLERINKIESNRKLYNK